jgi:DNA-binding LacI/PurR family transcriptional regulator
MSMATIHDVAALAGVSVSSVSNVMNKRTSKLSAETFARVEQAINQLGYRPNRIARQLKTGHTPMLGLLVPSTANPMYGQIALEIEKSAQKLFGYRLLLGNTHRNPSEEAGMFQDLLAFGIRSVIVVSSMADEAHMEEAALNGLSVVSFDRTTPAESGSLIDHIAPDNFRAGYLAADHLLSYGHSHLVFLVPRGRTVSRADKINGFLRRIHDSSGCATAEVIEGSVAESFGDSELAELGAAMASQIAQMQPMPTAVVTVNDMLAIGLLSGLHRLGLRVPEDVSVVGMDDLSIAAFTKPGLTTVAMPLAAMADAMVQRAIGRVSQPDMVPGSFIFQPALVERHSVAAPARK